MAKIGLLLTFGVVLLIAACVSNARLSDGNFTDAAACRITHVVDGDTLDLQCAGGAVERIRIMGYDTPETYYADCPAEKQLGDQATSRLRQLAATTAVTRVERDGQDRYDRTLARIWLGGVDLAEIMVAENLAVTYSGSRRIDWCARIAGAGTN